MDVNIPSQIVVQTAAQWAADATVYSAKRILVTSDAFWGSTDQRKFKIADGTQTWSNLDYPPFLVSNPTLAQVLASGATTGNTTITSPDGEQTLEVTDTIAQLYSNGGANNAFAGAYAIDGQVAMEGGNDLGDGNTVINATQLLNQHTDLINLDAPAVRLTQETASRVAILDASKDIVGADTATYPSLTEFSYGKGVTSPIQTQLNAKYRSETFFTTSNQSVADGGVYIFGQTGAPVNTAASASKVPVLAGTVVAVTTEVFSASTIGSTEGGTLKLWYNDGAASLTLATDFQVSANRSFFRAFTGLSTAINDGNCYIEYTAPTLATNPTAIRWMVTVYIR
jgi:hypothetical protein